MGNILKKYGKFLAAIAFIMMLTANYSVNAFHVNGTTTGEVSDSYPNLFAPIGLTFVIWGVIYLLLGLYSLRQFGIWRNKKSIHTDILINRITPLFIATSIINLTWILAWQYKVIWLSLVLILSLLVILVLINNILDIKELSSGRDYWLVRLPFSVYFGWVTVATIANITIWLISIGWTGWGLNEQFWTIVIITAGALVGTVTALRFWSTAYSLVFVWAYFGILLKHISPQYFNNKYPLIVLCTILFLGVFIFTAIFINSRLINRNEVN